MQWHPKAEDLLLDAADSAGEALRRRDVEPALQGSLEQQWLARFQDLLARQLPYCGVRYAF
jgi:hypothetical protein